MVAFGWVSSRIIFLINVVCRPGPRKHVPYTPEGNTAGPVAGAHVSPYNAAASANMAIWLSFEVWLANTYVCSVMKSYNKLNFDGWSRFRAFRPQYFLPSIIYSRFLFR
jgi:hypothetical protein